MCGRYRLSRREQLIEEYFATTSGEDDWSPHYNIAPTQPVPIIRQNPKEGQLFAFAGLWDRWRDPKRCDLSRPRPNARDS